MCFTVMLTLINTAADLVISGLLSHSYELSQPLQSVRGYLFVPLNLSIIETIGLLTFLQLTGALICHELFMLIAALVRSSRKYMAATMAVVMLSTLIVRYFYKLNAYIPIAITDKERLLTAIEYSPKTRSTNIAAVMILPTAVLAGLCIIRAVRSKKS